MTEERNTSNPFLPQQNSCGNLRDCGMSGQVTAWSLSFSLKWNNYPFSYGTNSTTKWSLGCASTNGEQSQAPVTPWPPRASQGWHMDTATTSTCDDKHSPTASQGTPILPSLLRTRTKRTAPGATGATGDRPLPEGTSLQPWFQSGQVRCAGAPCHWSHSGNGHSHFRRWQ